MQQFSSAYFFHIMQRVMHDEEILLHTKSCSIQIFSSLTFWVIEMKSSGLSGRHFGGVLGCNWSEEMKRMYVK